MVVSKRYQAAKAEKFASNIHKRGLIDDDEKVRRGDGLRGSGRRPCGACGAPRMLARGAGLTEDCSIAARADSSSLAAAANNSRRGASSRSGRW